MNTVCSYDLSRLTLNWHFTQNCNMRCRYCFVPLSQILSNTDQLNILAKICRSGIFTRINFVGGEPTTSFLLENFLQITKSYGIRTSIVTNGFKLIQNANDYCDRILAQLDGIGLSIDSLHPAINQAIGRSVCYKGTDKVIEKNEYEVLCNKVKNAGIPLKLNTVVSKLNHKENFCSFYSKVQPDRIKLFQVLKPNIRTKHCYDDLLISEDDYQAFVQRHHEYSDRIVPENNCDMLSSYYMLGSDGRFWDNLIGQKSASLLDVSIEQALSGVYVDLSKYEKRYA